LALNASGERRIGHGRSNPRILERRTRAIKMFIVVVSQKGGVNHDYEKYGTHSWV